MSTQYDGIYFNQSRVSGEVRMSTDGLGWRATQKVTAGSTSKVSKPFLLPASELMSATWSRGAHYYMLQIQTKSGSTVSLDGFEPEQFAGLQRALSASLDLTLEHREHSLRGWNWGKIDFERNELVMNVASKPDFEVPYGLIQSSNLVGKSEVAVELDLPASGERTTVGDEVVELRFYVPGQANDEGDESAAVSEAQLFHEQLQDRADIGATTGSELVQFTQVLFTTPRGRYDIQFFADSFRLHGKTYDYKVPYTSLQRVFVLPRLDELHNMLVLQLEPPLRQGQTRYPFLVLQIARDEEIEVELNVDDAEYDAQYKDKLERKYDAPAHEVMSALFHGLSGRKITHPGSFKSTRNLPAVSCMAKAAESALYPLDRAFLLISKTPMYLPYTEIEQVRFSRMATGHRTFDMTLRLRGGGSTGRGGNAGEVALTGLAREEHPALEQFLESKNLKIRDDADEARKARMAEVDEEMDVDGSESEEDADFDEEPSDDGSDDSDDSDAGSDDGSDAGSDDGSGSDDSGAESFDEAGLDTGDSKIAPKSERKRRK